MTSKHLYVPASLPEPPKDIRDATMYVLHRIYVGRALWNTEKGYTLLKAEYLQNITRKYNLALKWLLENNQIITDGYYLQGKKSRGYRWTAPYDSAVRREASPELSTVMDRASRKTFKEYTKAHRHLLKWLRKVTIDREGAKAYIASLPEDHPVKVEREAITATANLIAHREYEFSVCNYGRVHTPMTRLVKELRDFVTIEGKELVNIDIANSQPLVLSSLLLDHYHTDSRVSDTLSLSHLSSSPLTPSFAFPNPSLLPPNPIPYLYGSKRTLKTAVSRTPERGKERKDDDGIPADVREYVGLCENGGLYEELATSVGEELNTHTRKRFKEDVFGKVLYGRMKRDWKVTKAFRKRFPNVLAFIEDAKKDDYRTLAREMQRRESRIMIDTVVYRILMEHPEVPLVTIHDSIMTTPEHVEYVKGVIEDEFKRLGLRVTLRVEQKETNEAKPQNQANEEQAADPADPVSHHTGTTEWRDLRFESGEIRVVEGLSRRPQHAAVHPESTG